MTLSKYAQLTENTKGRAVPLPPCPVRNEYQRDRDRIIHSDAFRRLKRKTQVWVSPEDDHFRTRLTHTLEVQQIARTMARALRLNEDLAEAIALGHDLGHTPFGHEGERILRGLVPDGFEHNEQSLRVVDVLEDNGKGLNLTAEVRDGIKNHKMKLTPATLEGKVVSYADRIAYINHDIDDAIRAGLLSERELPKSAVKVLGGSKGKRIDSLVQNLVSTSKNKPKICMEQSHETAMRQLLDFMRERVYFAAARKKAYCVAIITTVFDFYCDNPHKMPDFYQKLVLDWGVERAVCDYISGMTDEYVVRQFNAV